MLARLLGLRPGEAPRVLAMFGLLGLVIATSYVLKPVRSALFLSQFGAERLPYVYILVALVLGVVATGFARWAPRCDLPRLFSGLALFFAVNLVAFWLLARADWRFTGYAFYVWVSIFTALMPSLFWLLANYVFYANEGRRLFPVVMAGGLLGSIAGGFATSFTVAIVGTPGLLLGAAVLLLLATALVRRIASRERDRMNERRADLFRQERTRSDPEGDTPLRSILRSRYLSMVAALVLVTGMISIVVDYQFNSVVEDAVGTRDELTAFFGSFFAIINIAAFLLQLFLAGRVLSSFGVVFGLLVLPLGLGLSSLSFLLFPSLLTAAAVKAVDDGTSNSLNRASVEVLYLPVALAVKNRLKAWVDMFVERVSRGVGGLLILAGTTFLSLGVRELSLAVLVLLVPWIGLVLLLKKEYVLAFRESLARRDIENLASSLDDPESLEVFRQVLAGDDAKGILYALELLRAADDPSLLEEVARLVSHPAPMVRSAALRVLRSAAAPPLPPDLAARVQDDDAEVAAEALALLLRVEPERGEAEFVALVERGARDRMTALLARLQDAEGLLPLPPLERIVVENGKSASAERRKLAARAIGFLPAGGENEDLWIALLRDSELDVARAAAASAGAYRSAAAFHELVGALGRPPLRAAARRALSRFGGEAIERLEELATNGSLHGEVRAALPGAIAEIEDQRSVEALLRMLPDSEPRFHYQAIKSLSRLRRRAPSLRFPRAPLERVLEIEASRLLELNGHAAALSRARERRSAHGLLVEVLAERVGFTRERIFRLLGLLYPQAEMAGLWIRIESGRPGVRAEALEYLAHVLSGGHRVLLLPLIETSSPKGGGGVRGTSVEASLRSLAQSDDTWLATCALATIGELRLSSLASVLESAREHPEWVVRDVAERALETTSAP